MSAKSNLSMALGIMLAASSAARGAEEWSLSWCEMGPVVAGERVRLVLADGEKVRGRALATKGDSLRVATDRSSDRKKYPTGENAFARDDILQVHILRSGHQGKAIGLLAGAVGGLFLGAAIGYLTENGSAAFYSWIGTGVGGFAIGDAADRKVIHIRLQPGDHQCTESPDVISADTAPPLIGIGGEPTYSTQKGERIHARTDAGQKVPRWGGVR